MTAHAYRPLDVRLAAPPSDRGRYHRRHLPIRLVVVVALVAVVLVALFTFGGMVGADGPVPVESYVVRSGDTLWGIAEARTPTGGDVRETMADIVEVNGLRSTSLSVGQVMELPTTP